MYRYLVDQLRNFPPVTTTKVVVGPWEKGKLKYREKKRALGGEKGELGISRKEGEDRQDAGLKETETSTGPETVPGTGSPQYKPVAEAATVSQDNERLEETEGVVADKKTTKQGVERREVTEEEEALPASKEDGEALYSNTDIETDGKSRKGKNNAVKKGQKKKRKWDK